MCSLHRNEYRNLSDWGHHEKWTGREEPIGVVILTCMETTPGISLHSYLLSQTSKNTIFLFLSFMFFLPQNLRTGGWNRFCRGRGVGTGRSGEVVGNG
jgi:hypothetical protein